MLESPNAPKAAMPIPRAFSIVSPGDAARAAELRRVKALATLVLAGTLALFVVAKLLLPVHPVFGFVAAFAEAATIGGLADWYAVVALFRRPLGLPIPHTAIIQSNQHRIADKLGEFSCIFSKRPRSMPSCARSTSAPSSPTGCATASAAPISPASRCICCRRRFRRHKPRA
jgi:hypothetical protein